MAVKIRLKRLGKIRSPHYRIVVADSRTKRDGRSIEEIGKYHPTENPSLIEIDSERAQYWLSVGAQPSEQVLALLKLSGDWGKFKGDKNAKNMIQTKEAKAAFEEDTKKKSVIRPRVEKKVEAVIETVAAVADDVVEAVAEAAESVADVAADVVENVAEAVADAAEAVADAAEAVAEAVAEEPAAEEAPAEEAPAEDAADEAASEDKAE